MEIKINGILLEATEGETILDVATRAGIKIPTLCYLKKFSATSNCRMCLVEVVGIKNLVTACSYRVQEGMKILTTSERVKKARKTNLELLLSNHNYDCNNCVRDGECELQRLATEYNADENRFAGEKTSVTLDNSSPCIIRDNSKCILCKRCVQACSEGQAVHAIKETNRGFNTTIETAFNRGLNNSSCVGCGQCIMVCPTGALSENQNIKELENILKDKTKVKVVAPAPAVRVALMETLGIKDAESAEKLLPSLLRAVGFDYVFDVNFGADLTVVLEAQEFLERLKTGKNLPMFTSCCPAWVEYAKKFYPEFVNNVSTCKSPLMMLGAVVKSYWAERTKNYPDNIRVVSVMPCTAKKKERTVNADVDLVITVRELEYIIKKMRIDISALTPSTFDSILGESSGAGVIFGTSGGVMEATIRTLADKIAGKELEKIDYKEVRGLDGVKTATIEIGENNVNIAVVSGLKNAETLIENINDKKINLHFVEVMSCEGGCINGGGMPFKKDIKTRMENLYFLDRARGCRKSHKNTEVQAFLDWKQKGGKIDLHTR